MQVLEVAPSPVYKFLMEWGKKGICTLREGPGLGNALF